MRRLYCDGGAFCHRRDLFRDAGNDAQPDPGHDLCAIARRELQQGMKGLLLRRRGGQLLSWSKKRLVLDGRFNHRPVEADVGENEEGSDAAPLWQEAQEDPEAELPRKLDTDTI